MSTGIEWTDETWNPTVGCSRVSPGCDHCYAIRVAAREMQSAHIGLTRHTDLVTAGPTVHKGAGPVDWTGEVRCLPDRLTTPLSWKRPRRVFVDSMSDLFHPDVPDVFIQKVFTIMGQPIEWAKPERHTFQVLTKRPQRMATFMQRLGWKFGQAMGGPWRLPETGDRPLNPVAALDGQGYPADEATNIWLGTSVENQRYADLRIPWLANTPAAVRFLSIEPLLGPVDIGPWIGAVPDAPCVIDWVIVGGESGRGARPMHPDWVRALRDQCLGAGIPFLFKQWGEFAPTGGRAGSHRVCLDGSWYPNPPTCVMSNEELIDRVGKKAAGRELDGRTWDEFPA